MPEPDRHPPSVLGLLGPWVADLDRATLRPTLKADLQAGLIGAVVVVPQGLAYATLAGLPPVWGLYTCIVPCIVAALLGSSRLMHSGPTNATSLALAAMLAPLVAVATAGAGGAAYLQAALLLTFATGLLQALLGALRLGALANFVSPSVLLGFTSGAALLIVWHALKALAGHGVGPGTGGLAGLHVSPAEAAVAALTLATALAGQRWLRAGQQMLLALVAGGLAAWALRAAGWPTAALDRVTAGLPGFEPLSLNVDVLQRLAGPALALAVVALGQTMAVGKALAGRRGELFDPNRECLAQGASNLVGPFFHCFVSGGSLNRSVLNEQSGARTPLAAVASALFVAVLVVAGGAVLAWIPAASITALLLLVAWSLVDRPHWTRVWRLDRIEAGIAALTLLATLTLSLDVAILGGVAASLATYLYRSARPALRSMGFDQPPADPADPGPPRYRPFVVVDAAPDADTEEIVPAPAVRHLPECPQLKLLRMEGSVYFGAVAHVGDHLHRLRAVQQPQRHLLVMGKSMSSIDLAGADLWETERIRRRAMGGDLYFHRPRPQVMDLWRRSGFLDRLGAGHIFDSKPAALAAIVPRLDPAICQACHARIFAECRAQPAPDHPADVGRQEPSP